MTIQNRIRFLMYSSEHVYQKLVLGNHIDGNKKDEMVVLLVDTCGRGF